ncbi:MAG: AMIN domain-containing protein [Actinobacteria bacterium]|nr:AMIN domain-containing protein [Actinomycetota bacterium]
MTARRAAAVLAAFALLAAACGDDALTSTTTTAAPPTTDAATTTLPPTTIPATTSSAPATSTTAAATTTTTAAATTTTAVPFDGDTSPETGTMAGSPSAQLVDVRVGNHPGFTRVVWEMDGDTGTPMYQVGYADPPFVNTGDQVIPVDGTAFLRVDFFPGMRYDITDPNEIVQTYLGPETIPVGTGAVVEVAFVDDFEAAMEWVIGLTGERPFKVFTLENPTRLVIDIGD